MNDVLEVRVSWGTQVLALRHLEVGTGFAIGDGGDFVLPNITRTEIVVARGGAWLVALPSGDTLDVTPQTCVSMDVEGVTIDVTSTRAEKPVGRGFVLVSGIALAIAISFIAHMTVMATMASFVPPANDDESTRGQMLAMMVLLNAANERESEETVDVALRHELSGDPRLDVPFVFESEPQLWGPPIAPKTGPVLREGDVSSTGKLPIEVIQRIVRQSFGRFRYCYEAELRKHPKLEGIVTTNIVIGRDGKVKHVIDGGSDLPNEEVVSCVVRNFKGLTFPPPEAGIVTASYPIAFEP